MEIDVERRPVEMIETELDALDGLDGRVAKPREAIVVEHVLVTSHDDPQSVRCEAQHLDLSRSACATHG